MPARKRGDGVTFQLVGWQWRRRRLFEMPMMWHIGNDGTGTQTTVHRLPRYWGWERNQYQIKAIGDRRSDPEATVKRRLEGRTELHADVVEEVLAEEIRGASQSGVTEGKIGADCIAVCIRLSDQCIRVRYLPASPMHAAYDVYTPWLIVPTVGSSAPSVMSGVPPTVHLGGLEVIVERASPPGPMSLPASMTSVERPSDP